MYNTRQFKDLKEGEIAGMGTINPIVRFLRNIRTTSQNVHIDGNPMGGIDIAVDQQQGGGGASSFRLGFQPTVNGNQLTIGAGLALVGTWTYDYEHTTEYDSGAPTVIPESVWTIDQSKQKYVFHYHSVITHAETFYTQTMTFAIERASSWPSYQIGDTINIHFRIPYMELLLVDGVYTPVIHNFGMLTLG